MRASDSSAYQGRSLDASEITGPRTAAGACQHKRTPR